MLTKADIKLIKSLSDKRDRVDSGLFVAEGPKMVGEAVDSGLNIERVFATDKFDADQIKGFEIEHVSGKEMERISHLKTPSNSLALVRIPKYDFDLNTPQKELVLALDDVQDPGNLGTIIRIADWFGIHHIICSPATADCFNPKVVQATMGALFRVKVHYLDLPSVLKKVSAGCNVYGTFLEGDNIYNTKLAPNGIVLMGNEGRGVSPASASAVTHRLFIPPYPVGRQGSESLNVATATAVICSEFRRQHTKIGVKRI